MRVESKPFCYYYSIPIVIPTNKLRTQFLMNFHMSSNGVYQTKTMWVESNISSIALYRIIETASLTIPSPNTTLNSWGYVSELMRVIAATESVAQMVADWSIICLTVNETKVPSPFATLTIP